MRLNLFWVLCISLLVFSIAAVAESQTNANGSFTNGSTIITISNGIVVGAIPVPSQPVLVSTNGQVIPSALTAAIAEQLGLSPAILQAIPLKYLFWLGMFVVVLPAVAQKVIKYVPADLLVNWGGVILSHLADIKNPTISSLAAVAKQVETVKANPAVANSPVYPPSSANTVTPPSPITPVKPPST